jgi:hypothetical protein
MYEMLCKAAYIGQANGPGELLPGLCDPLHRQCCGNGPGSTGFHEADKIREPASRANARVIPRFTVLGGVNVISTDTLSDAVISALACGQNGRAYLVGDENLSFAEYFGLYFQAVGDFRPLEVRDEFHPLISGAAVCKAPNSTIHYEPDHAEVAELSYRRKGPHDPDDRRCLSCPRWLIRLQGANLFFGCRRSILQWRRTAYAIMIGNRTRTLWHNASSPGGET